MRCSFYAYYPPASYPPKRRQVAVSSSGRAPGYALLTACLFILLMRRGLEVWADVEENLATREEQEEKLLDDGGLVLARRPDVRHEA